MHRWQFKDLEFDETFLFATRKGGETLKFTRAERALLLAFMASPNKLLTRAQLLEALPSSISHVSDRNIDNLMNRLRTKLGDPARDPRMIATQYGEGYIWIAEPVGSVSIKQALLVIGPVTGLDRLAPASTARACLIRLQYGLDALMADDQVIAIDEDWTGIRAGDAIRFSLETSFYDDHKRLHCAAILRQASTGQMLASFRLTLDQADAAAQAAELERAARAIKHAIWQHSTTGAGILAGPSDTPLELRMHDASRLFMRSDESWAQMAEQLAHTRQQNPDDPQANLMWAMHLYVRIITNPADVSQRIAFEGEIQAIVFDHLPAFQDNPIFLLGAAKLLLFVGRGHIDLAERLAEQAFATSTAFASSFATLGQIRMCRGDIAGAVDLYDHGIELAGEDSEFRVYLLVLKCVALLAADDRVALERTSAALYALKPVTRYQVGLSLAPAGPLPPDLDMLVSQFDAMRAGMGIVYVYYTFARLFERPAHRENIMRGLLGNLTQRFGTDIVPGEVWQSVPGLRPPI